MSEPQKELRTSLVDVLNRIDDRDRDIQHVSTALDSIDSVTIMLRHPGGYTRDLVLDTRRTTPVLHNLLDALRDAKLLLEMEASTLAAKYAGEPQKPMTATEVRESMSAGIAKARAVSAPHIANVIANAVADGELSSVDLSAYERHLVAREKRDGHAGS